MSMLACLTSGKDRAFSAYPRVDRYFPAAAIEEARQRLARCIDRGDGPALVIGPTGTGKTLVLQLLAAQFADRFNVAFLTSTANCTRRALLQSILFELRQPYRDREAGELRLALVEKLLDRDFCPNGLLLLVDEAHLLSTRLLEELRALGNLTCAGVPRLRLVLAGSLQLDELFSSPDLEIFNQRLSARCYLAPLRHAELVEYVRAHVAAVGANPDELFNSDALDALYQATDGIPRLVNQLCDRALLMIVAKQSKRIEKSTIEAAWADLQQLPTPWIVPAAPDASSPGVVEFGSLDDANAFIDEATELDNESDDPLAVAIVATNPNETNSESDEYDFVPETLAVRTWKQQAVDPFDESFQEEEVLLDRFASLESAFQPSTPRVRNRRETSWSQMLRDVDVESNAISQSGKMTCDSTTCEIDVLPESESVEMVADYFDEPLFPQFSQLLSPPTKPAVSSACSNSLNSKPVSEVLEIEEDAPTPALVNRQVQRREFRQLFASLRGD